ncbi:PQQ-dependent sugar dehydrogenase [Cytobacillus sp. S13-E01]|uniref:PQQ-dependent sugar dehydrogenase n=1 Tax=Cytobacillus sp. S13-E01 TaxID=3031326 RepID=UPI0023D83B45|nr:PQQ-dependent sugar dehydrogenase [Cytobacillus sp. S13-E01]MDF0727402.1 PQQ-dependent sugar dehydrogenase [Cytobacillus sp. S13-E01]
MRWLITVIVGLIILTGGCSYLNNGESMVEEDSIEAVVSASPEVLAKNLDIPWSIEKAGNTFYVTERKGTILRIDEETNKVTTNNLKVKKDVYHIGEGGLLGFVLAPNFETTNEAVIYYTYQEDNQILNRVVLIEKSGDMWREVRPLLENIPGGRIHNAGRLEIGPDQNLYITTGDAGRPEIAQSLDNLGGKILRMQINGDIPKDNPFENSFVYSFGHRNPQGLVWDENNNLYSSEHGQSAHDEINLIKPGKNYGWPVIQGDQVRDGMEKPLFHTGDYTWAPSGMGYYNGKLYVATLRDRRIRSFDLTTKKITVVFLQGGRMRDIYIQNSTLYALTNNRDGRGDPQEDDDKMIKFHLE